MLSVQIALCRHVHVEHYDVSVHGFRHVANDYTDNFQIDRFMGGSYSEFYLIWVLSHKSMVMSKLATDNYIVCAIDLIDGYSIT